MIIFNLCHLWKFKLGLGTKKGVSKPKANKVDWRMKSCRKNLYLHQYHHPHYQELHDHHQHRCHLEPQHVAYIFIIIIIFATAIIVLIPVSTNMIIINIILKLISYIVIIIITNIVLVTTYMMIINIILKLPRVEGHVGLRRTLQRQRMDLFLDQIRECNVEPG